jgi:hypothetical protein
MTADGEVSESNRGSFTAVQDDRAEAGGSPGRLTASEEANQSWIVATLRGAPVDLGAFPGFHLGLLSKRPSGTGGLCSGRVTGLLGSYFEGNSAGRDNLLERSATHPKFQ